MINEKLILEMYNEGKSITKIAFIFKKCTNTISEILEKNNIFIRYYNHYGKRFLIYKKEKEIVDLYTNHNKSTIELAKLFNVSLKPIRKILKRNNVKIRTGAGYFKRGNMVGALNKNNELRKQKDKIIEYYLKNKKTTEEISKIFNCGQTTICRILKENSIKTDFCHNRNIRTEEIINKYLNGKSTIDLAKEYGVTSTLIWKRLRNSGIPRRKINHQEIGRKSSITMKKLYAEGKIKSFIKDKKFEEYYGEKKAGELKEKIRDKRAKQIFPVNDTSIEIKIQNFLKQLGISFFTHQYINIKHKYRCDILIPSINLIIELDGDYWHGNPLFYPEEQLIQRQKEQKERDCIRTKELQEKGFKVLRLWENDIKKMELNDFKNKIENA